MNRRTLRVGTRGSDLALAQTRRVCAGIEPCSAQIIKTSGDVFQQAPLQQTSSIGFFTKEIERALLDKRIDLAVHSLKDLPTKLGSGLVLAALLERDDPGDVLLVRPEAVASGEPLSLREGAVVGASSLRRGALLRRYAPQCEQAPIRGNVPTRVSKLAQGDFDAIVLARAGLARLRLDVGELVAFDLNPRRWVCAPGQGVIAVEARENDVETLERLGALAHAETTRCAGVERRLLATLGGGCHVPFGAYAEASKEGLALHVAAPRGEEDAVARFVGRDEVVEDAASRWLLGQDVPEALQEESEAWLCRPAHPWC